MEFIEENYRYLFEDDYTFRIYELDNEDNNKKEIMFNRNNDYSVTIFDLADFSANFADEVNLTFNLNSNSPLYGAFLKLLGTKNSKKIVDDFYKGKMLEIKHEDYTIKINLISKTDENDCVKNAVQIKNIMVENRSQNNEIKKKLFELFNDVKIVFTEKVKDDLGYQKVR